MLSRWILALGLAAALAGCASSPSPHSQVAGTWDDGIWNSMLGYHGPANSMVVGGPSR